MTRHDDELIALLLGDRRRSPALARWLGTLEGRRELRAYRRTLDALQQMYGDAGAAPRRIIYYCAIPTPIGRVFVAATEAGLVRVSFRQSEASFVAELRQRLGHDVVRSPARTADIVHQLRAYFAGARRRFDVRLDPRHTTPFQRRVPMPAARLPVRPEAIAPVFLVAAMSPGVARLLPSGRDGRMVYPAMARDVSRLADRAAAGAPTREPFAARLHFVPRALRRPHTWLVRILRRYF